VEGTPSRKWGGNKSTRRITTEKELFHQKRNILKKFDPENRDWEKITPHKTIGAVSGKSDFLKKVSERRTGLLALWQSFSANRPAQAQL